MLHNVDDIQETEQENVMPQAEEENSDAVLRERRYQH